MRHYKPIFLLFLVACVGVSMINLATPVTQPSPQWVFLAGGGQVYEVHTLI